MSTVAPPHPARSSEPAFRVTNHAADRYVERVRPGLTRKAAQTELARLLAEHGQLVGRPEWVDTADATVTEHWALVGEDFAFPCHQINQAAFLVVTVLVRNHVTTGHRAALKRQRRYRIPKFARDRVEHGTDKRRTFRDRWEDDAQEAHAA